MRNISMSSRDSISRGIYSKSGPISRPPFVVAFTPTLPGYGTG
jgi:hypothetical protein